MQLTFNAAFIPRLISIFFTSPISLCSETRIQLGHEFSRVHNQLLDLNTVAPIGVQLTEDSVTVLVGER
jgi:hypothetical protein